MLKATKILMMGLTAVLAGAIALPALAQEVAPGEGGIIIEGNFGGDPATFNPILAGDTTSSRVSSFLYPGFIGVDPATATYVENDPSALVTEWEVSDDGLVYTFKIRTDWEWTDGTPITAADILYTWGAYVAASEGIVDSLGGFYVEYIESVESPAPDTIVVTFNEANCRALGYAAGLGPVPSHMLPADYAELNDAEFNLNPTVTAGVFNFGEFRPSELVSLVANQAYNGSENGVIPTGWIYKVVPDQTVLVEQFLAGETNVIDNAAVNRRADIAAAAERGEVQVFDFPGNAWDYLAMNYADPTNPQNALDEAGNPIDQGKHPLFGDPLVRQAVAHALNVDEMIQGAVFGQGARMNAYSVPASWAYPDDLPFIEYNPDLSRQLLEEAGWVDSDGDGVREKDGVRLAFTLYTNEGNTRRGAIGTIAQDALSEVGFEVDFQAIDFNTLLDIMDSQTYDAYILGWRNGYPDDPDQTQLFATSSDVVGAGSNNMSYSNPEVDELMRQANTVPGCDPEERAAIYAEIQAKLQADLPYVPLFVINGQYAARSTVEGFAPYPSQLYWNVDTWSVASN
jgi:peptide/nickel transport system substrate-binding protein